MATNSSVLVTADGEELEALNTDAIITSLSTNLTIAAIIFAIVALLVLLYPGTFRGPTLALSRRHTQCCRHAQNFTPHVCLVPLCWVTRTHPLPSKQHASCAEAGCCTCAA